jgi:BirA family biotin operon repressor/biotin-[acetyl-CoA-carboxylase] ligase
MKGARNSSQEGLTDTGRAPDRIIRRGPFVIHHYLAIDSTNDHLKSLIDAPEFTCIVADEQTAGRGRHTRRWHSSPGDGLYLSILIRPRSSASPATLLSLMAAIAVAETLSELGMDAIDVKWPNDVLVRERKICGILVEGSSAGPDSLRIIIGIGINLNHASFPADLASTATSFAIETGKPLPVDEARDNLLERILIWHERWNREPARSIIDRWEELSSYARGRQVIVTLNGQTISGETAGLTPEGALKIRTIDGDLKTVFSGELTNLRPMNE